jgi:hypothetical protein
MLRPPALAERTPRTPATSISSRAKNWRKRKQSCAARLLAAWLAAESAAPRLHEQAWLDADQRPASCDPVLNLGEPAYAAGRG